MSRSHRWEPRKPAPPATNTDPDRCISSGMGHFSYVVGRRSVAPRHARAEFGKLLVVARRAGVMGTHTARLGCEAEGHRHREFLQGTHLPVEPSKCSRTQAVRPTQPGAHVLDAQ